MKLNNRNIITIPLIVISSLIWIIIIYRIISYFNSLNDKDNDIVMVNVDTLKHSNSALPPDFIDDNTYVKLVNDPFSFYNDNESVPLTKNKDNLAPVKIKPILQYQIKGIIINGTDKSIILDDLTHNKTVFLKQGQNYNKIRIKSIQDTQVIVIDNGITKIYNFN